MGFLDDLLGTTATDITGVPSTSSIGNSDSGSYLGDLTVLPSFSDYLNMPSSNFGSNLDYSAGASGAAFIPATGNSLLDSLSKLSSSAINDITGGITAYGSYLETGLVSDLAKKLGVTPQALGANSTVPLATGINSPAVQKNALILYAGVAFIAAFILLRK